MSKLKSILISIVLVTASWGLILFSSPVLAADPVGGGTGADIAKQLQAAGGEQGAGYGAPQDPRVTVALIIRTALQVIGVLVLVLIIYAGFLWMTAGGNEEQVTKAKKWMYNSVVGLIIVVAAYSITLFVIKIALNQYDDINAPGVQIQPNYQPPNPYLYAPN